MTVTHAAHRKLPPRRARALVLVATLACLALVLSAGPAQAHYTYAGLDGNVTEIDDIHSEGRTCKGHESFPTPQGQFLHRDYSTQTITATSPGCTPWTYMDGEPLSLRICSLDGSGNCSSWTAA